MTISFQVNNVAPLAKAPLASTSCGAISTLKLGSEVEAFSAGAVIDYQGNAPTSNSFLDAVHTAYDSHLPLALRPDDFWMCIVQGFGIHVGENAEALRDHFVDHEGQKHIHIRRDGFLRGAAHNDWEGCFDEFSKEIGTIIGEDTQRLILPDFSTTTALDKAMGNLVLMDTMKSYFTYGMSTRCGFPKITLEGASDDWYNIYARVENLTKFDLGWWTDHLLPVLEKVIASVEGHPDITFWESFYKMHNGSGGPYVNGWVNTLFPYVDTGKIQINGVLSCWETTSWGGHTPDQFPNGLSTSPLVWDYYGTDFDYRLVGGFLGVQQDQDTLELRPNIGWSVGEVL